MRRERKRCRRCPDPPAPKALPVSTAAAEKAAAKLAGTSLTVASEAERLWSHILFGTGTCVGMLQGYADLDMPGDPLPGLRDLRDRLNRIIKHREQYASGNRKD
jgi:hypothetical protein